MKNFSVYIAAPFFTPDQLGLVMRIENAIERSGFEFFSPRKDGTLSKMTSFARIEAISKIYKSNIDNLKTNLVIIAVLDDYDPGTIFELGYFRCLKDTYNAMESITGNKRFILTISAQNYGVNVMLRESIDAHLKTIQEIEIALQMIQEHKTDLFHDVFAINMSPSESTI